MPENGIRFDFVDGAKSPRAEVLLVPLVTKPQPPLELVTRINSICDDAISELLATKSVRDEVGHIAHTTRPAAYRRVVLISLGEGGKLKASMVRQAAASAVNWIRAARVDQVALCVDGLMAAGLERAAAEWAGGMTLAGFRFEEYKSAEEEALTRVRVSLAAHEPDQVRRLLPEMQEDIALAQAINYTRRLAHQPANVINPTTLAAEARQLAGKSKLKCTVVETAQVKRLGMGGLMAVGAGAAEGPRLIQLEYKAAPRSRRLVVLVGKAITFDTGGYSIKPSAGLEKLKFDKCGGATVMGVMKAVLDLKLKCNVIGLIPTAENAVSAQAYRPGDILKMMSGKTVEVTNTDAEGRLVLADALTYAQKKFKPTEIIDVATLTGGVGIALGTVAAGLMSNNDDLAGELGECGRRTYERLWRLPLWEDYRELIVSTEADIKNASGKRDAHAIVGGMFLREFVSPEVAWAHLDIAAVATSEENRSPVGKGATGFGVRLLVDYLRR